MNPDRNKSGMSVNALLLTGMAASVGIPVLLFAVLGIVFANVPSKPISLGLAIIVCALASLLLVFTFYYFMQRRIKDKLVGLAEVCRDYSSGDRSARATYSGEDEFAMLASAINTVLDGSTGSSGAAASGGGGVIGTDAAALQAQIEKLLQEVSAVGDGDLRVQAEVTPDTLGVLADSFNYMIEELAKVVGRVQSTAVQVTNATRRILDRSADLAQASDAQVEQISQTSQAVEALAIFIQNVAQNAMTSVEVAQEALESATSGQESVKQTINGMMVIRENVQETSKKIKRLGERSNEIGEIVRIIEDIADQTNLLALNAAIQSAMAGEHGRGFAVVADEIRLLAERSTESTKRIGHLVKSIQGDTYDAVVAMEDSTQEVVKGSQLADEAGRALNSIYSAVERQAKMIESIARAANEQSPVSEAVAVTMAQISEVIRQTDAGTQEAAISVSYLSELSDQLRASVSTFKLPEHGNDASDTFSHLTSVTEMSNDGQMFPPALNPGQPPMQAEDWGQNFAGNFPPLPEPGNSGSLIALSSNSNQFGFNDQQEYAVSSSFGGQQYGNNGQQDFSFQSQFASQPNFSDPQFSDFSSFGDNSFSSQSSFGQFGGSQGFGDNGNQQFGNSQYSNNQYGTPQDFGDGNGFGGFESQLNQNGGRAFNGQNQAFLPPLSQLPSNPSSQPLSQGQLRQRRSNGSQPGQRQSSPFNSDQVPFSNNEDFGR
jgi:methyl-accepting chemotaxis protein